MEKVVVDSHALFWFFTENPKLSSKARNLIQESNEVVVPSIVLMEILYILEKSRLSPRFVEILSELKLRRYTIYPLDIDIVTQTLFISSRMEMHDRIIVATAQLFDYFLISKDPEIHKIYQKAVWI